MIPLVLASASPRRAQLLEAAGLIFEVEPSTVDEEALQPTGRPHAVASFLARAKALDVAARRPDAFVIAADTVVALRGRLFGKPRDAAEARDMLLQLRGRRHRVITAVCVVPAGSRRILSDSAVTLVDMRSYSEDEIAASIARGDPFDKAGGYGIQDPLLVPAAAYEGCYCNVVGLPVGLVAVLLRRAELDVNLQRPLPQCATCPLFDSQPEPSSSGAGEQRKP